MASRKLAARSNVILTALIVLGIAAVVNFISFRNAYARLDLTKGKEYTISSSTKQLLANLDDVVNVKAYFTKDIPENYRRIQDQVRDLLDEYRAYSKGNLRVEYINPADDQETEQKLRAAGVPRMQLQVLRKDKAETVLAYLGIVVTYETRKEALPAVLSTANLEYDLTSAILRVTRKEIPVIGVYGMGREDARFDTEYKAIKPELEKHYRLRPIDLAGGKSVPADVKTLLLLGDMTLTDREVYEIDQFIMRGGRAIFAVDSIAMQPQVVSQAQPVLSGIEPLLKNMGVKLGEDLVLDRAMANAPFERQQGMFRLKYYQPYPFWPMIQKGKINQDNPILSGINGLLFPWTRSLESVKGAGDAFEVIPLVSTSDQSWTMTGVYNLSPMQKIEPPAKTRSYMVAAVVHGTFKSTFAGKPVPETAAVEGQPPPPAPATVNESPETRIAVLGSSRVGADNIIQTHPPNAVFFLNLVDDLTLGDDLIGIRARTAATYPLREVSDTTATIVKFVGILGMPFLVIVFSLVRRMYRNRARAAQEALYR